MGVDGDKAASGTLTHASVSLLEKLQTDMSKLTIDKDPASKTRKMGTSVKDETMSTNTGGQGGATESEMDVDYDATFQSTDRDWLDPKKRCNAPALPINQMDPRYGEYLDAIQVPGCGHARRS